MAPIGPGFTVGAIFAFENNTSVRGCAVLCGKQSAAPVVTLIFKWFAEHTAVPPTFLVDWWRRAGAVRVFKSPVHCVIGPPRVCRIFEISA